MPPSGWSKGYPAGKTNCFDKYSHQIAFSSTLSEPMQWGAKCTLLPQHPEASAPRPSLSFNTNHHPSYSQGKQITENFVQLLCIVEWESQRLPSCILWLYWSTSMPHFFMFPLTMRYRTLAFLTTTPAFASIFYVTSTLDFKTKPFKDILEC